MSLWIDVYDATNGNPITDATFDTSAGNVSAFNEGNVWYYALIAPNTNFCVCVPNYPTACSNTDGYTPMSVSLLLDGKGW